MIKINLSVNFLKKIFYNYLTVNTTNPDELCKYYIGKKKCGPEDIESAKIIMGGD